MISVIGRRREKRHLTGEAGATCRSAGCGSRFTCHDGQMAERDRDESGRPRSTRPRDALGRPLPHGSEGVLRIPDDLALPPAETLAYAQDLLDRGLAFNAHEVLEAAWKNGPDDERMLWQGLAQLAVGITHVQRGNVKGAITLLRRASARLAHDDRPAPYAIDAAHLVAYADALIDDLAAGAEIHRSVCDPVWLPSYPNSMGVAADTWSCAAGRGRCRTPRRCAGGGADAEGIRREPHPCVGGSNAPCDW